MFEKHLKETAIAIVLFWLVTAGFASSGTFLDNLGTQIVPTLVFGLLYIAYKVFFAYLTERGK